MRFLIVSIVSIQLISMTLCETTKCTQLTEACYSTNYYSYVECVRKRHKRSSQTEDCDRNCNDCDCNSCNYDRCQTTCNECCGTCCHNYVPCSTNHCCHKTCHAQCSTSACRSNCRQKCFNSVKIRTSNGNNPPNLSIDNSNQHNVTTIIHLNNIINNTNIVDLPINLNSSNLQNVNLIQKSNSGSGQSCCTVIGPRQCVQDPYPRCFYLRSNQCGAFCTSSIVHKEQQQYCESIYPGAPPNCTTQITYIPQPKPRCVTQTEWPYVRCGIQKDVACAGCYRHYVDQNSTAHLGCPLQCYDDGFGMGPLYRQGPIYRPTFSHTPCCWYGGYPFSGDYGSSYGGGYGNGYAPGYGSPYGNGYGSPWSSGFMGPYGNAYPVGYPYGEPAYPPGKYFGQLPPGLPDLVVPNNFDLYNSNKSGFNFNGEVDVVSQLSNQPDRIGRELEIEMYHQAPPPAQARVEIKIDDHEKSTDVIDKNKHDSSTSTKVTNEKLKKKLS